MAEAKCLVSDVIITKKYGDVIVHLNRLDNQLIMVKGDNMLLFKPGDTLRFEQNQEQVQWKYRSVGYGSCEDNKTKKRVYSFSDTFLYDRWSKTANKWRTWQSCLLVRVCANFDNIVVSTSE
jgi:hypothetical protein